MTEPKRDPQAVCDALANAVLAHPEQRVTQVIVNALGRDPFYIEDADAVAKLNTYAKPS